MTYQPDYAEAIKTAAQIVGTQHAEAVVLTLLKSGAMVCVPRAKHTQGRKSYEQLLHENYALRDWIGVLVDEYCGVVNYQQYLQAAGDLLNRLGTNRPPLMIPGKFQVAADGLAKIVEESFYEGVALNRALRRYWSVRESS
jgi:hypothetical protein